MKGQPPLSTGPDEHDSWGFQSERKGITFKTGSRSTEKCQIKNTLGHHALKCKIINQERRRMSGRRRFCKKKRDALRHHLRSNQVEAKKRNRS